MNSRPNATSKKHNSTKFDIDGLKNNDLKAIERTTEIFPILSQGQKDLIRHQAPEAYAKIVDVTNNVFRSIKDADDSTRQAQANTGRLSHDTHRETLNSNKSESEKRDSYEKNDRMHEREINAQTHQHTVTMDAIRDIGKTALVTATVAGTAFLVKRLFD